MAYWKQEQDLLVIRWKIAVEFNNKKEQLFVYNQLIEPITYMAISIYNRYFNFGSVNEEDMVQEVISHLFCNLHKFDKERNTNSYSYCQTIIKNYFNTIARQKANDTEEKIESRKIDIEYYGGADEEINYENHYITNPNDTTNDDVMEERLNAVIARLTA